MLPRSTVLIPARPPQFGAIGSQIGSRLGPRLNDWTCKRECLEADALGVRKRRRAPALEVTLDCSWGVVTAPRRGATTWPRNHMRRPPVSDMVCYRAWTKREYEVDVCGNDA